MSVDKTDFGVVLCKHANFYRFDKEPGKGISFPIFTRKEIETKRIRKEIKIIISRLDGFLSFLSNI